MSGLWVREDEIPGMSVEDIGHAYVVISGQGISEAVAVIVSDDGKAVGIRSNGVVALDFGA